MGGNASDNQYSKALTLAESGEIDKAITLLREIVKSDPNHATAQNDLGALLFQKGDLPAAKNELSVAYRKSPHESFIIENYLEVLLAGEELEEVYPQLQDLVIQVSANRELVKRIADYVSKNSAKNRLSQWDRTIEAVTQKVTNRILEYLPEGGVLIDIGANTGLLTEQVLRARNVKAYLFEPVPRYFEYCQQKFRSNPEIKIENLALADSPGQLTLYMDQENLGWNTLESTKCTPGMTPVDIQAVTFDDYAEQNSIRKIDVIKIDVEGAEYRVLGGMRNTLAKLKNKPVIICEVGWGPSGHPNWPAEVEAFEWLFKNGYKKCDYNVTGTSDVIFVPEKSGSASAFGSNSISCTTTPFFTLGILLSDFPTIGSSDLSEFRFEILSSEITHTYPAAPHMRRFSRQADISDLQQIFDLSRSEYVLICSDSSFPTPATIHRLISLITISPEIAGALYGDSGLFRRSTVLSRSEPLRSINSAPMLGEWMTRNGKLVIQQPDQSKVPNLTEEVRVLMLYDEQGWAWWHRAHHIKNNVESLVDVDIRQMHEPVNYDEYDFIFLFDHNLLESITPLATVDSKKIILGNSCPKYIGPASEMVQAGKALVGVTNNIAAWCELRKKGRWYYCPNGVDLTLFYPKKGPLTPRTACWVGHSKSIGNKGLEYIRSACDRMGYKLVVLDANDRKAGGKHLSQAEVRDQIYHNASVFICASEFEGTPNPGLEALACGLPVISTAVGNMTEIIVDGWNGYIVQRNVEDIARALKLHSMSDLEAFSTHARQSVENGWSWQTQALRYADIFRRLKAELPPS